MTQLLDYVLLVLAVHRLTRLIVEDAIFSKVREKIWRKSPAYAVGAGYLITCFWCMSLWLATPIFVLYKMQPDATIIVLGGFALSSAAALLDRVGQR